MTKYKAISLFSGLGGDTLGLQDAGCDVIAYNEIDKHFCKSHEINYPNSELIHHEDDRNIQNQVFAFFVRSPIAHGKINSVAVESAKLSPGGSTKNVIQSSSYSSIIDKPPLTSISKSIIFFFAIAVSIGSIGVAYLLP